LTAWLGVGRGIEYTLFETTDVAPDDFETTLANLERDQKLFITDGTLRRPSQSNGFEIHSGRDSLKRRKRLSIRIKHSGQVVIEALASDDIARDLRKLLEGGH